MILEIRVACSNSTIWSHIVRGAATLMDQTAELGLLRTDDEIEIEDMVWDDKAKVFHYPW